MTTPEPEPFDKLLDRLAPNSPDFTPDAVGSDAASERKLSKGSARPKTLSGDAASAGMTDITGKDLTGQEVLGMFRKKTKFKEHRGTLEDSMKTLIEVEDETALRLALHHVSPKIVANAISQVPYGYDDRIGWDCYIITLDGFGVLGFSDGPIPGVTMDKKP